MLSDLIKLHYRSWERARERERERKERALFRGSINEWASSMVSESQVGCSFAFFWYVKRSVPFRSLTLSTTIKSYTSELGIYKMGTFSAPGRWKASRGQILDPTLPSGHAWWGEMVPNPRVDILIHPVMTAQPPVHISCWPGVCVCVCVLDIVCTLLQRTWESKCVRASVRKCINTNLTGARTRCGDSFPQRSIWAANL